MNRMVLAKNLLLWTIMVVSMSTLLAQSVSINETSVPLNTYGFGKPNPVPILAENPKIYPYFKFEEYQHHPQKKNWKVITLENDFIKVMVLPEIGGKVWGAIEKSTGEEFLYKNEVIKFRNIAMRGPWTSGGIEFNFGIIGHHPSTASPVDYVIRNNEDGSVSCVVGNKDLPSDTYWWVEIRLEKDKAYFETRASWYNASPLTESYYNWMTAAAVATYDLEFFIPGNAYVEHGGNAHPWPVDEMGRNLSFYKNNTFGPSKSYHVVGEYNDFFGGYYHDRNFGFGQWAPYEEMPGQKLWLWDLSRSGGIWEDLLTDSDGQYIEFQAGRLFDQYFPGDTNPISQMGFDPFGMDTWQEIWFPYKEIGGMVDASKEGVLNVIQKENEIYIGLNALQKLQQEIKISLNGKLFYSEYLDLGPMEVYNKTIPANYTDKVKVEVAGTELDFSNDSERNILKRPFYPDEKLQVSKAEQLYEEGCEAMEFREYIQAYGLFSQLIGMDPSHRAGLVKLAELEYRRTRYQSALALANTVLKMDTYNAAANYIAGLSYRALDDRINALESLGWAARDVKYRSAAYAQMAEIELGTNNYQRAKRYALKALDFNTYNLNARSVLAVVDRKTDDTSGFANEILSILKIDPLNHFALAENGFAKSQKLSLDIKNEFAAETIRSLALKYRSLGLYEEAIKIMELGSDNTLNELYMAYWTKETVPSESVVLISKAVGSSSDFVFPYLRETLPILEWATKQDDHWKIKYYLALNQLAVGLLKEGKITLKSLGNIPDADAFYRFRAAMLKEDPLINRAADYARALALNPKDWKVWEDNIQFYLQNNDFEEALQLSAKAYKKFSVNYNIGLAHAKALLNNGKYAAVIKILKNIQVLPYEHASESRDIYVRAHLGEAVAQLQKKRYEAAIPILLKSKEWPENIGVGKPYAPDERLQDYLLAISKGKIGELDGKTEILMDVVAYTQDHIGNPSINHLFGLMALKQLDRQKELDELATKLVESLPGDVINTLVLAVFENDIDTIKRLRANYNIPNDTWDAIRTAMVL